MSGKKMAMDAGELNEATRDLLEQLADRLPKRRLAGYRALGEAGESVTVLNEICKMLVARHTEIDPAEKEVLTRLIDAVPHDAVGFEFIADRDRTLDAIEVAEQPSVVTNDDLRKLNADSRALLESVADRLPEDRLEEYRKLSFVGEWTPLIDFLAARLVMDQIPVLPSERDALAALLGWFRPATVADHPRIRDKESTLASLNVVDQL